MTNFDKDAYLGQWYEYSNVFEFYEDLPCKYVSQSYLFFAHWNMTQPNLSIMDYLHRHRYKFSFAVGGKCVRATYTDEGDEVGVFNEFVSEV